MNEAMREMPKYVCHKEVHALCITAVSGEALIFADAPASVIVGEKWLNRHKPEAGGYYVVYKDGYTSYSPAKAFEDGYTRVETGKL